MHGASTPSTPGRKPLPDDRPDDEEPPDGPCPNGEALCDKRCVDPHNDRNHCGTCGNVCAPEHICFLGMCVLEDPPPPPPPTPGRWVQLGPWVGGRLSGIVAKEDDRELFVASPGGGVWYTNNNGTTWVDPSDRTRRPMADRNAFHLERDADFVSPAPFGRIFATTWSDLYATEDNGQTWRNLTGLGGYPAPPMPTSRADPRPFTLLKQSGRRVVFWAKPCDGLYFSSEANLSLTFQRIVPLLAGSVTPGGCIQSIAADDMTGHVFLCVVDVAGGTHIYRSSCPFNDAWPVCAGGAGGLVWHDVTGTLPPLNGPTLSWNGVANEISLLTYESDNASHVWRGVMVDRSDPTAPPVTTWTQLTAMPSGGMPPFTSSDPRPLLWFDAHTFVLGSVVPYQYTGARPGASEVNLWHDIMSVSNPHADVRAFYRSRPEDRHQSLWMATDGTAFGQLANIMTVPLTALTRESWRARGDSPLRGGQVPTARCDTCLPPRSGFSAWQAFQVAVTGDARVPGDLDRVCTYIATIDNGAASASGRSNAWSDGGLDPAALPWGDAMSFAFSPRGDTNVGYSRGSGGALGEEPGTRLPRSTQLARTNNAGSACGTAPWRLVRLYDSTGPYRGKGVLTLPTRVTTSTITAVDPNDPNHVYFVADGEVIVARYDEATGRMNIERILNLPIDPSSGAARTPFTPTSIFLEPAGVGGLNHIYVGSVGGGAFVFRFDGLTVSEFGLNLGGADPPPVAVMAITRVPDVNGRSIFLIGTTSGLYRNVGDGLGWRRVIGDGRYTASALAVDNSCPGVVYAGMGWADRFGVHRGGVLVSGDSGENWWSMSAGHDIHAVPITSLQVDPRRSRYVHVGTYGRGAWLYDWGPRGCPWASS